MSSNTNSKVDFKTKNIWSLLICLVDEQENNIQAIKETQSRTSKVSTHKGTKDKTESLEQMVDRIHTMMDEKLDDLKQWSNRFDEDQSRSAEEEHTGIPDSGAASGVTNEQDAKVMQDTNKMTNKTFLMPNNTKAQATDVKKLRWPPMSTATEMNVGPGLHTTLVSVPKMADANYVTVFDRTKARVYDGTKVKLQVKEKTILEGYRCPATGLWRVPLKSHVTNSNTETLLLNQPSPTEAICNIFNLSSIEKNCEVSPCSSRGSDKRKVDQSNKSWKFCHVALTHMLFLAHQ